VVEPRRGGDSGTEEESWGQEWTRWRDGCSRCPFYRSGAVRCLGRQLTGSECVFMASAISNRERQQGREMAERRF
jgi:hypothetical protein